MSFNVPTSGQYITFPVKIIRCVEINWSENSVSRTAMYYVTRCFWGYLENQDILTSAETDAAGQKTTKPIVLAANKKIKARGKIISLKGREV
jgi:hypothetical protein